MTSIDSMGEFPKVPEEPTTTDEFVECPACAGKPGSLCESCYQNRRTIIHLRTRYEHLCSLVAGEESLKVQQAFDTRNAALEQRDEAERRARESQAAGKRLYKYLKNALNSWLPAMLDELNDDEEGDNEMISGLADMLVECAPALDIKE